MVKQVPTRSEIPVEQTWDLESIFASDQLWEDSFTQVGQQLPQLRALQGTLGQSGSALNSALRLRDQVSEVLERLYVYASMRFHEDTTRPNYQALADRAMSLVAEFSAAISFFVPEILAIPSERLDQFIASEPGLALYRHQLEEITRARPHVRSAEVEQVLAEMLELMQAPDRIFEMIENADLRLPIVRDGEGNELQLSHGNYTMLMRSPKREVRRDAFEGMHATFKQQQNTIAANFSTQVKKNIVVARTRHYASAIEAALDANNIPVSVYSNLVDTVEANLAPLHRYLRLRQRALKLDDTQHMYDLYVPLVPEAAVEIDFDAARERVTAALEPLGSQYTEVLSRGMHSRWIDVYENQGKRSGAYSGGAYSTHPYVLLNFQSQLEDMFTLAHEMGHSMHSYFTRSTQPYPYGDYTIFLAEIASTFNEALLTQYLLRTTQDPVIKAYIINHYVDGFRSTFYRQAMFASFRANRPRTRRGRRIPDSRAALRHLQRSQ